LSVSNIREKFLDEDCYEEPHRGVLVFA